MKANKTLTCLFTVAFLALSALQSSALVVMLSDLVPSDPNGVTESFLTSNFSNVTEIRHANYANFTNTASQDALNGTGAFAGMGAADVVIIGRSLSSGDYDNGDADGYNGLTIPVVSLTSYISRQDGNRMGWHAEGVTAGESVNGDETVVTAAGAAILGFEAGTYDFLIPSSNGDTTYSATANGTAGFGGGQVLATVGTTTLAAYWAPGSEPGHPNANVATFPGPRLLFNTDNDPNSGNNGANDIGKMNGAGILALITAIDFATPLTASQVTPTFVANPADTTVLLGGQTVLSALSGGAPPISYQWRKDGTPIPDATNRTYVIDVAALSDAGTYDVVASNGSGATTSDPAAVTVGLPEIEPTAQTVLETFTGTFTITMPTNTTAYTYAWTGPTGPIAGATGPVLELTNITSADAGTYTVDVTLGGDTLSASGTLTVPATPTATYVSLITTANPVVWWRLGEAPGITNIVDQMGNLDAIALLDPTQGVSGAILGDPDTAMEFPGTAKVEADPFGVLPSADFTVEFWALSSGGSAFRSPVSLREDGGTGERWGWTFYATDANQWRFDSYDGTAGPWNSIVGPAVVQGKWTHIVGTYDGTDMSFYVNGSLAGTVASAPYLYTDLIPLWIGAGGGGAFGAAGSFPWEGKVDEVAIYDRALTSAEVLEHYAAAFDVSAAPAIASQPANQAVLIGEQAVLRVGVVSGTNPSYQWRKDGVDIVGATSESLVLDPLVVTDAGDYDVVVSNAAGSATSTAATLVPLVDLLGTLVLPDDTNTVLTRDGSSDWFGVETQPAGKWNRRAVFGITPLTPWGFQGNQGAENGGDLELRTTITGLKPNTAYAVWTHYSTKGNSDGTITGQAIRTALSGFDGEGTRVFSPSDESYTGVYAADFWWVYQAYLGVRTSDGAGTIAVLFDYAPGSERTVYQAVGYQEAVPQVIPPVISIPPTTKAALIGDSATFTVSAGSLVPMTYQWQFNGADLPGETNETLNIASVQRGDAGTYQVVVSNSEGSVTSDPADLVALIDYVGTFVYPDSSNTVLTRDGSSDWFAATQVDAQANSQWWARGDFAVAGIPAATNAFFANGTLQTNGSTEVRTTISGLDPAESYAVWLLYAYDPPSAGSRIQGGFVGEVGTTWDNISGQDTAIATATGGYTVWQGLLGLRTPDASGNLDVLVDYRGLTQSIYVGLGYQLAVLAPDIAMDISLVGGAVTVTWPDGGGTLQESEDLTNPAAWTDVPGATPPYTDPGSAPDKAFRLTN